ncbi:hypothetical protein [Hymenobacter psychrophilus]|uniref:Uncharacterized protein n=1 Tax=Hymenobacter psychrophilus TaxID=651662 RepID=A0A1H3NPD4_9BACT|nr:hypothetical protein [Hymenobacter psychrophilus]SDY90684.1 hypothetical protein SAMN04488069_11822 [Hymenobacter psychrophilus]
MLAKDPIAEYPFAQAALWQRCLDLLPALDRDAALLAPRGVTAARIAQFKHDTEEFGDMDPDTVMVQQGVTVTEGKDAVRIALETAMQQVLGIIASQDDPRSARYKRFGASSITAMSDAKLHLGATMLTKQGRRYLAEYAGVGLTEAMLADIDTQNAAFVDFLADRREAESSRAGATQGRVRFANGLYRQLVQLCAVGEAYWRLTDAAKAAEYVVNPGVPTAAAPRPVVG